MFVTKLTAVFHASAGVIGVAGSLRCSGSLPWTNWKMNRNRMLIAEKASTLRAYAPQDCSDFGSAPMSR